MYALAEINWDGMFTMPNFAILCVFGMVTIVGVSGAIAGCWQQSKKYEHEARVKRDLIAKGYSADEIERVVKVGSHKK